MSPLSMDYLRGMLECPSPKGSAISSRGLTRSQLGRLICSLAPHISLIKTAYRAPSNQVSAAYPSEPMRVTSWFVRCRKGLRLHGAVSDKVRDELCFILELCGIRTIAERPLSHRQMTSFRQRVGAFLLKTPDLVLTDFDAPRSFTIVDIKNQDCGPSSGFLRQHEYT